LFLDEAEIKVEKVELEEIEDDRKKKDDMI